MNAHRYKLNHAANVLALEIHLAEQHLISSGRTPARETVLADPRVLTAWLVLRRLIRDGKAVTV